MIHAPAEAERNIKNAAEAENEERLTTARPEKNPQAKALYARKQKYCIGGIVMPEKSEKM